MSILRNLIVRPSRISAICGILTEKDTEVTYVNNEYNNKMSGKPVDYVLSGGNGMLIEMANGFDFNSTPLLNGVFLLTHRDESTKGKKTVAIAVKDNVIQVVTDSKGLIWTNLNGSPRSLQIECLRKSMSPDNYDLYINRKVKSDLASSLFF